MAKFINIETGEVVDVEAVDGKFEVSRMVKGVVEKISRGNGSKAERLGDVKEEVAKVSNEDLRALFVPAGQDGINLLKANPIATKKKGGKK
jgi:hypothetical protein